MDTLFALYGLVERFGAPLAVAAWPVAFGAVLGLGAWLRGRLGPHRRAFAVALGVSLAAHLLDVALTLYITPNLKIEANPIWLVVVRTMGVPFAIAYGVTGKVLTGILHAECLAAYLVLRPRLQPAEAPTFRAFVQRFGAAAGGGVSWLRVAAFFAFAFGAFAPFFFYISLLNAIGGVWERFDVYDALPSPLPAAIGYGLALAVGYYVVSWRAYVRETRDVVTRS
jgi:hypothetical protein